VYALKRGECLPDTTAWLSKVHAASVELRQQDEDDSFLFFLKVGEPVETRLAQTRTERETQDIYVQRVIESIPLDEAESSRSR